MENNTRFIPPCEKARKAFLERFKKSEMGESLLLGRSILSRDIDLYKIGSGTRNVLYVGAHHGAEYLTASVLFDFIELLMKKRKNRASLFGHDSDLLLKEFSFWIVPCMNPDGVELALNGIDDNPLSARQTRMNPSLDFSDWQANARGVDLNHNYDYGFAEYKKLEIESDITPGKTRYSGEYPESEPEVRSLASLVRSVSFSLVLSLHTQGEEIYYHPKTPRVFRLAERAEKCIGYKIKNAEGFAAFGGLCDYTGEILGVPSLTLELGKGKNPLPHSQYDAISSRVIPLLCLLPTYL